MAVLDDSSYLSRWVEQQTPRRGVIPMGLKLTAIFGLVSTVVLLAAFLSVSLLFRPSTTDDPFAAYDAIGPGRSVWALNHFHCDSLYDFPYTRDLSTYCQIRPESGPIVSINILVRAGVIQQ